MTIDVISWDERYPDPTVLRGEVKSILDAYVETLFEFIPQDELKGIYFKGSAQKEWDTPLDYVPELSDVDIHVLFATAPRGEFPDTVEDALAIAAAAERKFYENIAAPVHFPRVQLMVLNRLMEEPDFMGTPPGATTVLYGAEPPETDYGDVERIVELDSQRLVAEESFLRRLPPQLVDRPGRYIWDVLRRLTWRVAPAGPRALTVLGAAPPGEVWVANRTAVIGLLRDAGEDALADDYSRFYLYGWDYFLLGYEDFDAARSCALAGARVLVRTIEIGKSRSGS
ncbi:MAG: hypothetical protein JSW52_10675 [Candidatus Coatesbacteria bacterium]|nr:MAG: hypothetical protein JSW52_10675 [Candidatus Coatesbacteria bacterium]